MILVEFFQGYFTFKRTRPCYAKGLLGIFNVDCKVVNVGKVIARYIYTSPPIWFSVRGVVLGK